MRRQYTTGKAGDLKHAATHIRQSKGTDEDLVQLGRSYLARPLYPIIVSLALLILDGHRRHAAVLKVGGPEAEVPICITDEPWSEAVKLEIQLESAAHQRGLNPYEQFLGCSKWIELNPGAAAADLAQRLHLSPGHLAKVLSLSKCIPAVQEAAEAGRLSVSDWYAISRASDAKEQHELLAMKLAGLSRDALEREGRRRKRSGSTETVRLARVKCPMPGGVTVSLAAQGDGVTLDEVEATLVALLKEVRKGKDQGLDSKTFSAVLRDKAKAM